MKFATSLKALSMSGLAACALTLGACSSEPDGGDESDVAAKDDDAPAMDAASVEAEHDKLAKPEPGHYSMDITIEKVSMAGMPAGTEDMLREQMQKQFPDGYCLTPEEADQGFDRVYDQITQGGQCDFTDFKVEDGNIDGRAKCEMQGGSMTYRMTGKAWETGSDLTAEMSTMAQGRSMDLTLRMKSERTGECAA